MSTSKQPLDLRAVVQARLAQLTFVKRLRLKDVPRKECSAPTFATFRELLLQTLRTAKDLPA